MKIQLRKILEENQYGYDIKNYLEGLKLRGDSNLKDIINFKKDQMKVNKQKLDNIKKVINQKDTNDTVENYDSKDSKLKRD